MRNRLFNISSSICAESGVKAIRRNKKVEKTTQLPTSFNN